MTIKKKPAGSLLFAGSHDEARASKHKVRTAVICPGQGTISSSKPSIDQELIRELVLITTTEAIVFHNISEDGWVDSIEASRWQHE